MIRFTWLQSRTQSAVAAAALVVLAIGLSITGPHLLHLYHTEVGSCGANGNCAAARMVYLRNDGTLRTWLGVLVIVLPGVIGIFWGAPLVAREFEAGTYRLAWTQSVSRSRWLGVKLGVIGVSSMAVAGLLSLMVSWWASPLDRAHMTRFATFDQRDLVPIGYAAFAFALGVTAGVLIRRTVPAMATTLIAFVTVRLTFVHLIRSHLIPAATRSLALDPTSTGYGSSGSLFSGFGPSNLQPAPPDMPNAWITSTRIVDDAGRGLSSKALNTACPTLGRGGPGPGLPRTGLAAGRSASQVPAAVQQTLHDCVVRVGATFHEIVAYQPASRYWRFQWYEMLIFVGAALVLAGICFWWVRDRNV